MSSLVISTDPKANGVNTAGNSEGSKSKSANEEGSIQVEVNAEVSAMNSKFDDLNKKYEELKALARDGKKKGEVAKHSKPQIKRSIGFLWDMKHGVEDVKEGVQSVIDWIFNEKPLNTDEVLKLKDKVNNLDKLIDDEMEANDIASSSKFGWGTVKYYENYSVFKDKDDCEKKTLRFHTAEGKARGAYNIRSWRGRGRGRSSFHNNSSYNNSSYNNSSFNNSSSSQSNFNERKRKFNDFNPINLAETICFKCNNKGHMRKDCPKN